MKRILSLMVGFFAVICTANANVSQYNPPANLSVSDMYENFARLSWNASGDAVSWIVNYKVQQASSATEIAVEDTSVMISDLVVGLRYFWKVKMVDWNGDTTAWSEISTFVTLSSDSSCQSVSNLVLASSTQDGFVTQWDMAPGQLLWKVSYGEVGINPDEDLSAATISDLAYTMSGLTSAQTYQVAVQGLCGGGISAWKYMNVRYVAANQVWNLPIQIDFETEGANERVGFINGISNPWYIGTAAGSASMGAKSMYISSDEGATTACIDSPTRSYAFMDFYVPDTASSFYIDFKWKSNTQTADDALKVYMLVDNSQIGTDQSPQSVYQIGSLSYTGVFPQWQSEHIEMPTNTYGYINRIAFVWNSTSASSLGIALDDIYITGRYCPPPDSLRHSNVTANQATVNWNSRNDQTLFNIQYCKTGDTVWQTLNGIPEDSVTAHGGLVLEGLTENTNYIYRIQADCGSEQSFWSQTDTFHTAVLVPSPADLHLTNLIDTAASFVWTSPDEISRCLFEYSITGEGAISTEISTNTITLSNLIPNTYYTARVRCISDGGDTSQYGNEVLFQTYCSAIDTYPSVTLPDTIRCLQAGYCDVEQCWRTNSDTLLSPYYDFMPLGSPYLSINYKTTNDCELLIYTDGGGYTPLDTLTAVDSFVTKTYDLLLYENESLVRFAFVNKDVLINPDDTFATYNFTIGDQCLSPERLNLVSLNHNAVAINWNAYQNNTQWLIRLRNLTNGDTILGIADTNYWSYDTLTLNNEYEIGVKAVCSTNDTAETYTELAFTAQDYNCMPPSNLHCEYSTAGNEQTIICEWDSTGMIYYWEIEYKAQNTEIDLHHDTVWLFAQYTIRDVIDNDMYQIRVRTVCDPASEPSPWSNVVLVNTNALSAVPYEQKSFQIYPNPTQGTINIKSDLKELKQGQLINSQGIVLKVWESLPMTINVENLPSGTYFIKVLVNDVPVSKPFTIKR
ncbi:MAG: fibronectin type III domain-containing protein [Bacteroidales bacterium]|jgi:hypothetical protein|nr:fibronectin type III domain-containing protein [Bacteroidales bacterium]